MLARVGGMMAKGAGGGVPTPPPTTDIDFLTVNDVAGLPAGSIFTRASTATRINASGVLEEVAANVMRIQHDAAGVRQGLLLEEAATNVYPNTRDLSVWSVSNTAWTAAAGIAPNGLAEASRLTNAATTTSHFTQPAGLATVAAAGEAWAWSVHIKPETATIVQIGLPIGNFGAVYANFDLVNGVLGSTSAGAVASITKYASGWCRVTLAGTSTAVTSQTPSIGFIPNLTAARLPSFTGTGETLLAWGAQFEKNPFPTSVILPPVGTPAATTRARDELTLPGALVDQVTGSMSIRYAPARNGGAGEWPASRPVFFAGNGLPNCIRWLLGANKQPQANIRTANVNELLSGPAQFLLPDTPASMCMAWGAGSGHSAFQGSAVIVDATAPPPVGAPTICRVNGGETNAIPGVNQITRFIRIWSGTKLTAQQVQQESARTS